MKTGDQIDNNYIRLAEINVNGKTEEKNGFTYLSWAWAVDQLLRLDPLASWEYKEPVKWGQSVMVFCTVTAFGKPMTAQLPVIDHRNKSIIDPDAFQINVSMQRCLVKAIALHGLGLYLYAGEDLPFDPEAPEPEKQAPKPFKKEEGNKEYTIRNTEHKMAHTKGLVLKKWEREDGSLWIRFKTEKGEADVLCMDGESYDACKVDQEIHLGIKYNEKKQLVIVDWIPF